MAASDAMNRLRVLLADDDDVGRTLLGSMLQLVGFQVDYARDGCDVVSLSCRERYDVILMDLHMRPMDGITASLFIRLKEQSTGRRTRIVATTADTSKEYRQKCLATGMDAYLVKPLVLSEVVHVVNEVATNLRAAGNKRVPRVLRSSSGDWQGKKIVPEWGMSRQ